MITKKRTITNYINNEYKNFAIHTLNSRGIPNFYDSLTPVQRIILMNSPIKNTKTLSVVGDCIKDDYHSGPAALGNAINRLARPYACAESLLIGDGFFGNQITSQAAASRYTSIMINPLISNIIDKYNFLNKKIGDTYNPLSIDIPIGLLLPVIGIAVGYSTIILPRKLKDIQNYLDSSIKKIKPHFKDFNGTVEKYDNLDNTWLIEGKISINESKKIIEILSIPPLTKYSSFIKKLDKILESIDCKFTNNSKTDIHILIELYNKSEPEVWQTLKDRIQKASKLIVKENIVFIKDSVVLEYASVEDYLDDFKIKNEMVYKESLNFNLNFYIKEHKYLTAKLEYLLWMNKKIASVMIIREDMIQEFLNKYEKDISNRLEDIKLKRLNETEIDSTKQKIEDYNKLISEQKVKLKDQELFVSSLTTTLKTKKKNILSLCDVELLSNDVEFFIPEDEEIIEDDN